ncbi:MAG: hypothetical protein V7637_3998 [Mycobacteriales bacterium]
MAVEQADHDRAERLAQEAIRLLGPLHDTWILLNALTHLWAADALRSRSRRAARLYGAISGLREQTGSAAIPVYQAVNDRCQHVVTETLGATDAQALFAQGRRMTLDAIVALACEQTDQ